MLSFFDGFFFVELESFGQAADESKQKVFFTKGAKNDAAEDRSGVADFFVFLEDLLRRI